MRSRAFRIGPADHDKFLAVEAFDLEPQPAIAGDIGRIAAFRDDAFDFRGAGLSVKSRAEADLVIAVLQGGFRRGQQTGEPLLAFDQRALGEILAVEIKKIEQEEDETGGVAGVGRQLDHAERGDAVGAHAAQLAVEIGLARGERRHGGRDLRVFGGPVKPVAG